MTDRRAGDLSEIRSVGRALDLLEIMRRTAPAGIRVRDAAASLGIDPATASRLMSTLMTRGYASRMPNRRFTLGARSLRLASGWVDRLLQLASAPMHRIADTCGETVYLLQLVGTEAVTLASLSAGRRATIDGEVGPSYPLWPTAAGSGAPWHVAGCAEPSAFAGGTLPGLHSTNQDHLVRGVCCRAGRQAQWHLFRGG